jgi:hypothetical protein
MNVEIKALITRQLPAENRYVVNVSIIDAINIDINVLMFDEEHNTFSHVATVYDMETYPVSRAAAHDAGLQFYRARGVSREFTTVAEAVYFENVTETRLKQLTDSWKLRIEDFESHRYVTLTSGS